MLKSFNLSQKKRVFLQTVRIPKNACFQHCSCFVDLCCIIRSFEFSASLANQHFTSMLCYMYSINIWKEKWNPNMKKYSGMKKPPDASSKLCDLPWLTPSSPIWIMVFRSLMATNWTEMKPWVFSATLPIFRVRRVKVYESILSSYIYI